jgi:hypothetical protein
MSTILAIDPGLCSGWAVGQIRGADGLGLYSMLLGCGVCSINDLMLPFDHCPHSVLVVELPQIYPGPRKEDPNDQITLAVNHGRWLQRAGQDVQVLTPHPKEWKGSVPKRIHQPRILSALAPQERALIPDLPQSKLHNAIDAVGLFLWACGRMHGGR